MTQQLSFSYEEWPDDAALSEQDRTLLEEARRVTELAYAPYSNFWVGAAARLVSGSLVVGTNQENASYPVGICAERVLLGHAAVRFPNDPIETIAISYHPKDRSSQIPLYPCGMCRQAILEQENISNSPIEIWLKGQGDVVYAINSVKDLLPINFDGSCLV